jgi:2'-5' RNA ligase
MAHIDTSDTIRASVWIRPTGDALERVVRAIRIAHRSTNGPPIQPHVSLLGGIETTTASADLKLKHLAARLKPFEIRLGDIDWRDEYYRCLFVTVEPSEALERAHRLAHEAFEMMPPDPFEPHISIAYGNVDESVKESVAEDLNGRVDAAFTAMTVALVNASESVPIPEWRTLMEKRFEATANR